jgi:hypothetical protein
VKEPTPDRQEEKDDDNCDVVDAASVAIERQSTEIETVAAEQAPGDSIVRVME